MLKLTLLKTANAALKPFGVQLYKDGMDMESVLKLVARMPGQPATVIDIGASTGRWSDMAMAHFPRSRFIGVDPLSEREPALKRLKAKRPLFDYVLCVAGEKESDVVEMAVTGNLDGSTVGGKAEVMRKVPLHSVDAIVATKKCEGPFMLKFDTHGFEVPILKGAAKTLERTQYIVMEVYNFRHTEGTLIFHEMCTLLEGMGFRCFNLVDPMQRPLDRAFWQMDLFFARADNSIFSDNSYYPKP